MLAAVRLHGQPPSIHPGCQVLELPKKLRHSLVNVQNLLVLEPEHVNVIIICWLPLDYRA